MIEHLTLFELHKRLKEHIATKFSQLMWVVGEINDLKEHTNGHCYLELIEKSEQTDKIVAKTKATIWASTFRMLKPYFETTTSQNLKIGLKILVKVYVNFDELYGYSLHIRDVDPTYTIGDIALKRQDIIRKLNEEGIIDMNKQLELPHIPQKIAIISSPTAAGYEDFVNQLGNNHYNFKFYHKLFPATMQGDKSEQSIIDALDKIYNYENFFDIVVLIRGGGSQTDLSSFDNYQLAQNIAQFPIPIITGIGHQRDDTIADRVAYKKLKTPTAVAEFLILRLSEILQYLNDLERNIIDNINILINNHIEELNRISRSFTPMVRDIITQKNHQLDLMNNTAFSLTKYFINTKKSNLGKHTQELTSKVRYNLYNRNNNLKEKKIKITNLIHHLLIKRHHRLEILENQSNNNNPENILKKGYSISLINGKGLRSIKNINTGDIVETLLKDGIINSEVKNKKRWEKKR